jgi:Pentapeptide repeats (8 copies)
MGSRKSIWRYGGIYALEQIAHDSPTDRWTIIEVLSTYVRENSPTTNQTGKIAGGHSPLRTATPPAEAGDQHLRVDIQAILTVIGRRYITHDPRNRRVDLSHSDLRGAHLEEASLYVADLEGAYLQNAHLCGGP